MQCSFFVFFFSLLFECQSVFVFYECFMSRSSCFGLEILGHIWIVVNIHVEIRVMDAASEHVSRRRDRQGVCTFTYAHYWFLHTHTVNVLTCLWNSTGALLTSPRLSSLPPHLLLCSSHSFLPPPLREEKFVTHLPLTAEWWTTLWRGLFFYLWPRRLSCGDPGLFGTKDGNKGRALPHTWSWRPADAAAWECFGGVEGCEPQPLLQFASSLSLILPLSLPGCFPSPQQALLRSRTPSLFSSSPPLCPGEFVCSNYMGTHRDREEAFALLNWA